MSNEAESIESRVEKIEKILLEQSISGIHTFELIKAMHTTIQSQQEIIKVLHEADNILKEYIDKVVGHIIKTGGRLE